jgi:hypothetical protein
MMYCKYKIYVYIYMHTCKHICMYVCGGGGGVVGVWFFVCVSE